MSYHVSILRTRGREQIPIREEEIEPAARGRPGWRYERETKTLFSSEPQPYGLQLWLSDGELWTRNPDGPGIERMLEIAQALDARVRGEELETYRGAEDAYTHPDDAAEKAALDAAADASLKAFRRRERIKWTIRWTIGAIAAISLLLRWWRHS